MPNSVLEAMGFGLPVITTPVGGIIDFFEDNKNGLFVKMKSSISIKDKVELLINDKLLMRNIAVRNHQYARENFKASVVAKRNEEIFKTIMNF
jgi:glycosyltransferase involved in cell wall biosynthesis